MIKRDIKPALSLLALLVACASGCAPIGPYEPCPASGRSCQGGTCVAWRSGAICAPRCSTSEECDAIDPAVDAFCLDGQCVPVACTGDDDFRLAESDLFCRGGSFHLCTEAGAPCSQCRRACAAGTFCDETTELCTAPRPPGGTCTGRDECDSARCVEGRCELPLFAACVGGDPCICVEGRCTQRCDAEFGDSVAGCGAGNACVDGYPDQLDPDPDIYHDRGWCHARCDGDRPACPDGQRCILPPGYFESTEVRVCAWGSAPLRE